MNPEILDKVINGQNNETITSITEFVGCTVGDTVGLVIANLDSELRNQMGLNENFRSVGLVSARQGGESHIWAADEAVKATNTEIASIQFARDMKGGAGRGATIVFAAYDVSDARRAVEIMLESVKKHMGDVHVCDVGHVELHHTARASLALEAAYGAKEGHSVGVIVGAPAAIGIVMADTAIKTASVDVVKYIDVNSSGYSNQIIVVLTGDSAAVKQAVISAKEVGFNILKSMGQRPVSLGNPTI